LFYAIRALGLMVNTLRQPGCPSRFAQLSPLAARAILSTAIVAAWMLVAITFSPWKSGFAGTPSGSPGDIGLYHAEAERIRKGESYYAAAKAELEPRGYPTRSIFNWRTPLPVWLVGVLPAGADRALLVAMAAAMMAIAGHTLAKEFGLMRAIVALVLLSGALMPVLLKSAYIMPEVWSGVLIGLSLVCYGIERRGFAVIFGLASLFVRELAAPYCVVCGLLALRDRRWKEFIAWALGAVAYATFYAWHISQVLPLIEPDALAHGQGWLQLGGAAFVISLVQMNIYLLLLPQWLTALYLVVAMLGFAAWQGAWAQRAAWTACLYVLTFAFVGQPFNQYWGALIAPLFCVGAAQGLPALRDVWRASRLPLAATWSQDEVA